VDAYNAEFNRDIEPMRGGSTDDLYYQLIANVRRFKGARPIPFASAPQTIDVNGDFLGWKTVAPEFRASVGKTLHRDHAGWGDLHYVNNSGRNDIIASKVARDDKNAYFYARTAQPLSPSSDPHWMMLFINADRSAATGWNGYDFLINGTVLNGHETTISRWQNGSWKRIGRARFSVKGTELQIAVPLSSIGQSVAKVGFDFKWVDNADPNDLPTWFVNGDCAPPRRFNYRFQTSAAR